MDAARYIDELLFENASEEKILAEITNAIALVDERNEYIKILYMKGV